MKKPFFLILIIAWTLLNSNSMAMAARVAADLDKTTARVQEEIHLTIRVLDFQGNVQAPRVQGIDGFDIFYTGRASHLTFINGTSSSSVEFNYVLVPQKTGTFLIHPIDIQAGGQNFRTEPINVEILPGAQAPSQSQNPPNSSSWRPPQQVLNSQRAPLYPPVTQAPATQNQAPPQSEPGPSVRPEDDNIYAIAKVNKTLAYPNEQILLTYSLYTRYDTRYEGFQEEPEVSGFWIEEFPMDQNVPKENVFVNGKRYIKADVKKYALFPTSPADYTIKPGTLKASIRRDPQRNSVFDEFFDDSFFSGGNFFARREDLILKPPPIRLQIKPFPEQNKPKSFVGAVGNFRLSSSVDKTTLKQDEPVTMTLVIEGEGNIETLNKPPIPNLEGFRTYDADAKHQLFRTGDQIGGRKTFEIVFIPTKAGRMVIPSLEFSYFNPSIQQYATLRTQETTLNVEKSDQIFTLPAQLGQNENLKKDVEVEKRDIRYIQEKISKTGSPERTTLMLAVLGVIDIGLTIFLLLNYLTQKRTEIFSRNVALKRRTQAKSRAEKRLKKLISMMHRGDHGNEGLYFDEIEKILTQYLTDKFNLSTLGITRMDLEKKLEEILGPQDPFYQELMSLYSWCDISRFAKAAVSQEERNKAQLILKEAIYRLEKIR
ncbi:MAG: hypothetical protein EXS63_00380 [Candidatus Omnitrophica bacterium]|nr:hypothetical protein [Candidatus Omnitrophota bacterium]